MREMRGLNSSIWWLDGGLSWCLPIEDGESYNESTSVVRLDVLRVGSTPLGMDTYTLLCSKNAH